MKKLLVYWCEEMQESPVLTMLLLVQAWLLPSSFVRHVPGRWTALVLAVAVFVVLPVAGRVWRAAAHARNDARLQEATQLTEEAKERMRKLIAKWRAEGFHASADSASRAMDRIDPDWNRGAKA